MGNLLSMGGKDAKWVGGGWVWVVVVGGGGVGWVIGLWGWDDSCGSRASQRGLGVIHVTGYYAILPCDRLHQTPIAFISFPKGNGNHGW